MKRKSENLENKLSDTTAPPLQRRRPPSYTRFSDKFYEVYKLFKATEVDIDEIEMHLVSLLDACNATKRAVEQNEIAIADKNNVVTIVHSSFKLCHCKDALGPDAAEAEDLMESILKLLPAAYHREKFNFDELKEQQTNTPTASRSRAQPPPPNSI